jgi:fucose permease
VTAASINADLRRARVAVTSTFGAHAFVAGTIGPWIPRLKASAGLDAGGLGIALFGFATGLVSGTRLAGPLTRRFGARRVVRIGIPAHAVALSLLPLSGGLVALTGSFVVVGIVSGLLDVAMNDEAAAVEESMGHRVMSSMHATWSVSMLAGAAVASLGLAAGLSIRTYVPGVTVLVIAVTFPILRWLPRRPSTAPGERTDTAPAQSSSFARVALLCIIAGASFMTEGIAAEWSAVYLHEGLGAASAVAGFGVVAFSAGMALSRLIGDRLAERLSASVVVGVGAAVGGAALAASIVARGPALTIAALAALGLGLGPAVPLAFSAAARIPLGHGRTALSTAVTAGYVGSIVGPLIVGLTAEVASLGAAFVVPVVMCAAIAATARATSAPRSPRS